MNKYYLALGGASPQVCTIEEIGSLIRQGQAKGDTRVCEVGATKWSTLGELLPQLFSGLPPEAAVAPAPAPAGPSQASKAMAGIGKAIGGAFARLGATTWMFFKRIMVRNFTAAHASEPEKKALERAVVPIKSPVAQNYAAWRRAMLWFAGVGLGVGVVSEFISNLELVNTPEFEGKIPGVFWFIIWGTFFCMVAGFIFPIIAAFFWTDVRRSRRIAWVGWALQFFGPFLILMVPVRHFISSGFWEMVNNGQPLDEKSQLVMNVTMAAIIAGTGILILLPRILGLFPGILRAGLTLRTLVPESPLPGWLCTVFSPLFALMFLVTVMIAVQVGGGALFLSLLFFLMIPLLLLLDVKKLTRPATVEVMNQQMSRLKFKVNIAIAFGLVFLLIAASQFITREIIWKLVSAACQFVGNIYLLTVVFSDFFLALMRLAHNQQKALVTTPLYDEMDRRYEELAEMRLAELGGTRRARAEAARAGAPSGSPTPTTAPAGPLPMSTEAPAPSTPPTQISGSPPGKE